MQDITMYSDDELSLIVFNDEGLYNERKYSSFLDTIDEFFIYTDEQLSVLIQDLTDDAEAEQWLNMNTRSLNTRHGLEIKWKDWMSMALWGGN